jgi:hypothetical protein
MAVAISSGAQVAEDGGQVVEVLGDERKRGAFGRLRFDREAVRGMSKRAASSLSFYSKSVR